MQLLRRFLPGPGRCAQHPSQLGRAGSALAPVSSLAFPPHKPLEMKDKAGDITQPLLSLAVWMLGSDSSLRTTYLSLPPHLSFSLH